MKDTAFYKAAEILKLQSDKRPSGKSDTLVEQTTLSNDAVMTLTSRFTEEGCESLRMVFHKEGYPTTDIKITRSSVLVISGEHTDSSIHNVLNVVRLSIVGERLCRLPNE